MSYNDTAYVKKLKKKLLLQVQEALELSPLTGAELSKKSGMSQPFISALRRRGPDEVEQLTMDRLVRFLETLDVQVKLKCRYLNEDEAC